MTKGNIAYLTRKEMFCASHRLVSKHLSDEENKRIFGKCYHVNGHGHNYVLEVTVRSPIDPATGMVMNLFDMKEIMQAHVLDKVDHKHMNLDVPQFKDLNPTVENMAVTFWGWLVDKLPAGMLYEIKLYETENNFAIYRGESA